MDQCERSGLLLRGTEGHEALVHLDPNSIVRPEGKEKIGGSHFLDLPRTCQERGLDGHAFLESYVADEAVGDRGTLFRSFRRFSGRLDHLLLHLVPGKAFLDLDHARGFQVDHDSCGLAFFGFAVLPPVDRIGAEYIHPGGFLAVLLGEGFHRFLLECEELLYVVEER